MPTPADVWNVLDPLVPTYEQPDGSNWAPPFTEWYYRWVAQWCAITDSYGLVHAGFSDDGGETMNLGRLFGIVQTTPKGWAYCPYIEDAFRNAGLWSDEPQEGDLFITDGQNHTGFVRKVLADGYFLTREGNYGNMLTEARRHKGSVRGFCRVPYDGISSGGPAKVRYLRAGDTGDDVRLIQRSLLALGYTLPVWGADGDFGDETIAAVRKFQEDHPPLEVDGVVGDNTRAAVEAAGQPVPQLPEPPPPPAPTIPEFPGLLYYRRTRHMRGDAVRTMQQRLSDLGYNIGRFGADGNLGRDTGLAMQQFQRNNPPLKVDGIFGPVSWPVLWA